jgi:hypothetical protein
MDTAAFAPSWCIIMSGFILNKLFTIIPTQFVSDLIISVKQELKTLVNDFIS